MLGGDEKKNMCCEASRCCHIVCVHINEKLFARHTLGDCLACERYRRGEIPIYQIHSLCTAMHFVISTIVCIYFIGKVLSRRLLNLLENFKRPKPA